MAKFCGGLKFNPDTFKIEKGIITLVDATDPLEYTTTPCGQMFDGVIFETVKLDGRHNILTAAGVDAEIPLTKPIKSNCGFMADSRFFSKDENGVLDFVERHLLEVLVNPADVEYTIEVTLTSGGEPVEPFAGVDNVYPLDEIDEEYTVTVNAEGYNEFTTEITADTDHIVQATLTPTE